MGHRDIQNLFYITHAENVPSILERGILSHEKVDELGLSPHSVYDREIVERRRACQTPDGRSLWSFANVYFQPRNPMMYRLTYEVPRKLLAVLSVNANVLELPAVYVTDGNAASDGTTIVPRAEMKRVIKTIHEARHLDWWNDVDGSKRRIMAEALVPSQIAPNYIDSIYVATWDGKKHLEGLVGERPIIRHPDFFFSWAVETMLTNKMRLVYGDMFFSRLQTLTVSVNTKGIMGKGLASRAKWQFPDVYVQYQNACRKGALKMGKPYLYKRESSIARRLADDPESFINGSDSATWFLLFATKNDWRHDAYLPGIERGLRWVVDNYQREGIESLAMPALGCGLGNLRWEEVGPIMCRYLSQLEIQVDIHLPTDQVPSEHLTREFLLGDEVKQ